MKVPNQYEMREKLEKELHFVEDKSDFISKKFIDLEVDTINQGRNLIKDVVLICTTITGFVIPLILNSNVQVNKNLLLISAGCFIITIIYGILLRLFTLRKELKNYPAALTEALNKFNKDKIIINNALSDLTQENYFNAYKEIVDLHKKDEEKEKWWKKFINHDIGFYGLFFIAIILLIISVFIKNL